MSQQLLFEDIGLEVPETEGIKYAGSKLKLLPYILRLAKKNGAETVFDGFSGTTRVSQAFAKSGYTVIANDVSEWSKIFGLCYLKNTYDRGHYQPIIDHLNNLPGKDGWFTEHYGGRPNASRSEGDCLKRPWQIHNTRKLDAIREEIDKLSVSEIEKAVLLTSLILALDEVDSTIGHYASYLNQWSPRSYKTMKMQVPLVFPQSKNHDVFHGDIFDITKKIETDLAYFDPPYGSNNEKMPPSRVRYAAYYHIWTTLCLNDRPALFGKANRRVDSSDRVAASIFEDFNRGVSGRFVVVEAIEKLIHQTRSRHIILSYSSGGRATADELGQVLESAGEIEDFISVDYKKNVMAAMRWTNDWIREVDEPNKEYLFLLRKRY